MARARNIKPSFFTNEILGTLDPMVGLTFIGLWCLADKEGILEDRPLRIKAELFPYREGVDVNGYLTVLERTGFVVRYVVDGVRYVQVLNFEKHQHPHHTERSKGFPKPQAIPSKDVLTPLNNSDTPSDSGFIDSLIPEKGDAAQAAPPSPTAVALPLIDKTEFEISQAMVQDWQETYPAVDVMQQLREMRAWCIANSANRKTRKGVSSFIVRWLGKEQDRAPRKQSSTDPRGILAGAI